MYIASLLCVFISLTLVNGYGYGYGSNAYNTGYASYAQPLPPPSYAEPIPPPPPPPPSYAEPIPPPPPSYNMPPPAYQGPPPMMPEESVENYDETEVHQVRRFGTRQHIGGRHDSVVHHVYEPMGGPMMGGPFMGGPPMFGGVPPGGGLVSGLMNMLFGRRRRATPTSGKLA